MWSVLLEFFLIDCIGLIEKENAISRDIRAHPAFHLRVGCALVSFLG